MNKLSSLHKIYIFAHLNKGHSLQYFNIVKQAQEASNALGFLLFFTDIIIIANRSFTKKEKDNKKPLTMLFGGFITIFNEGENIKG